ncbi:hypothetical protein PV381_42435, partial [Streptomyces scabiei]|uniref:hypothetical protein n=1 Tax=Streptomyces scabiei TaxID=1930 RepID=UPI0029A40797
RGCVRVAAAGDAKRRFVRGETESDEPKRGFVRKPDTDEAKRRFIREVTETETATETERQPETAAGGTGAGRFATGPK